MRFLLVRRRRGVSIDPFPLFRDRCERGDGPLDQLVMNSDMLSTLAASRSS